MPRIRFFKHKLLANSGTDAEISFPVTDQIGWLTGRLEELESAISNLQIMLNTENSTYYQDEFFKQSLTKYLFEAAAVRRKLAELTP